MLIEVIGDQFQRGQQLHFRLLRCGLAAPAPAAILAIEADLGVWKLLVIGGSYVLTQVVTIIVVTFYSYPRTGCEQFPWALSPKSGDRC